MLNWFSPLVTLQRIHDIIHVSILSLQTALDQSNNESIVPEPVVNFIDFMYPRYQHNDDFEIEIERTEREQDFCHCFVHKK